jgi:hypothetical protein
MVSAQVLEMTRQDRRSLPACAAAQPILQEAKRSLDIETGQLPPPFDCPNPPHPAECHKACPSLSKPTLERRSFRVNGVGRHSSFEFKGLASESVE